MVWQKMISRIIMSGFDAGWCWMWMSCVRESLQLHVCSEFLRLGEFTDDWSCLGVGSHFCFW
jgi:hypothetical protein